MDARGCLGLAHGYVRQAQLCGEVKRGGAIVREVWVLQALGVVFDDAFEEGEILEVDGSTDADGDVNPAVLLSSRAGKTSSSRNGGLT